MGQWQKVCIAVGFSISATLLAMLAMSQLPGLEIPGPYWVFGILCPGFISAPVSIVLVRQAEANRLLNTQLLAAHAELQWQADHDQLTGVLNRAAFHRAASGLVAESPGCLLVADIDHFKQINDRMGHAQGDAALRMVARTLQAATREDDLIGRIGGEEFAILLRDVPLDLGHAIAERACQAVASLPALTGAGPPIALAVSIGIAPLTTGMALEAALAAADGAMYSAKRGGRNRVLVAA